MKCLCLYSIPTLKMIRVIVTVHGFKIAFGGQRSTGFGLIYDSVASAEKSLAKYLLYREGIQTKPQSEIRLPPSNKNTLPVPMPNPTSSSTFSFLWAIVAPRHIPSTWLPPSSWTHACWILEEEEEEGIETLRDQRENSNSRHSV